MTDVFDPVKIGEQIADLRQRASNLRESAARCERYHTTFDERKQARDLDEKADGLAELLEEKGAA